MEIGHSKNPGDLGKPVEFGDQSILPDIERQELSGTHLGNVESLRRRIEALVVHSIGAFAEGEVSDGSEQAINGWGLAIGVRLGVAAPG
jgi:hypothetical protein